MTNEDAELLRRYVKERSDAAFAELVQRHLALVYSTALRQLNGDVHAAEDVAQTVFIALARKAAALTAYRSLAGWLYLSAHHAATQIIRSERRRQVREQEAHTMQDFSLRLESNPDWEQVRPVLDDAVRELGHADREAVLLRYFEGRPFAEIGSALKVSEDAARMRVERALEKLRFLLGRRGIVSTAAALGTILGEHGVVAAPAGLAITVTGVALAEIAATTTATLLIPTAFMSKITVTLSLAAALAATVASFFFANQAHRAKALAEQTKYEMASLRTQLAASEVRDTHPILPTAPTKENQFRFSAKIAPTNQNVNAPNGVSSAEKIEESKFYVLPAPADRAEAKKQVRARNGVSIEANYASLFRKLQFTPEQIEKFKDAKLEAQDQGGDVFRSKVAAARNENPALDRAGIQVIFDQTSAEFDHKVRETLRREFGDSFLQELKQYESNAPARSIAGKLQETMFYTASPLTPAQADDLVAIMAKQPRSSADVIDPNTMDATEVFQAAQTILSPHQLIAFRQIITRETGQLIAEERLNNHAPSATTTAP